MALISGDFSTLCLHISGLHSQSLLPHPERLKPLLWVCILIRDHASALWKHKNSLAPYLTAFCNQAIKQGVKSVIHLFSHRGIWRSVQRAFESAWKARAAGGHQNPESGLHGETAARFSRRSQYNGAVWSSQHHSLGRCCHKKYVLAPDEGLN